MRITQELQRMKSMGKNDLIRGMKKTTTWPEPSASVLKQSFVEFLEYTTSAELLLFCDTFMSVEFVDRDVKRVPVTIRIDDHSLIVFYLERIKISPWWKRGQIAGDIVDSATEYGWYQVVNQQLVSPLTTYYLSTALALAGMSIEELSEYAEVQEVVEELAW